MIIFKVYECPVCGFSAWALDHILVVKCHICGTLVETKYREREDNQVSSFPRIDDSS